LLVIVSNREDLTTDWLVLELERRGQAFLRLCSEDYPAKIGVELTPEKAMLQLGDGLLDASAISAVWWRRSVAPVMAVEDDRHLAKWAAGEALVAWEGFWQTVDAHWVNQPEASAHANCKPLQLQEARRCGLTVPPTLITNDLGSARAFQKRHRRIVCKPLHDGAVSEHGGEHHLYTQRLADDALDEVTHLGRGPFLFQGLVDKVADIRATVVGDRVFACRIDSQATRETMVDWRRGATVDLAHEEHEMDNETVQRLLRLVRRFRLRFAAIDLALDHHGRYTFFEVNPNGQWAWIEQITGQPLAAALADELCNAHEH
jgi:hypothetical protein